MIAKISIGVLLMVLAFVAGIKSPIFAQVDTTTTTPTDTPMPLPTPTPSLTPTTPSGAPSTGGGFLAQ
jgi:hypothetical protein